MSNSFCFKQFTIEQNNAAMKVGTDGVLLGSWADCRNSKTILDIGTGTGLIAIMLAQRFNSSIHGIEIDTSAYIDAKKNITLCKWNNRITVENISLQEYCLKNNNKFDSIVCNPPYFSDSYKANSSSRNNARHDDSLDLNTLFLHVSDLLNDNGSFHIVYPSDRYSDLVKIAALHNLHSNYELYIKPTPDKPHKRVLISFSNTKSVNPKSSSMVIEANGRHQYSDEYKDLTKDFYLNF